ncbi:MAG TPA: hypothetical protein VI318_17995 [Baekduia sp.]
MPPLPPLLSERPPAVRVGVIVVAPLLFGFVTGAMLGESVAAWAVANVIATLGGFLAGFDHDDLREAARRGALGGLLFGLALVCADALVVDDRVATIADPAILQVVVTTIAGTLLAVAGCALRGRLARRAAVAAADA